MSDQQLRRAAICAVVLFWVLVGVTVAYASPPKHKAPDGFTAGFSGQCGETMMCSSTIAPSPITIKCPCDLHVKDGTIEVSGSGQIVVGPRTTDYAGGHWQSDAPVSIDNHAPKKDER
jgi:hypothetical protein